MANHISHAALPYPIKNARFTVIVTYLDADGDPTDPTTPDTELSGDAGAFADCAEEVTTITGSNGAGYITLTGAETNYSSVVIAAKVASGPKATLAVLAPRTLVSIGTGTLSAGSAGGGTLGTILEYDLTGCFIRTTGGTGGGGAGGASNQARKIATYNTSTGAFTVVPNWETTPDNTTTYELHLPEGVTLGMLKTLNPTTAGRTLRVETDNMAYADVREFGGTSVTARDIGASVLLSSGTGAGQISLSSGAVTVGSLTTAAILSIWEQPTAALTGLGTAGRLLVDIATYIDTEVAAIKAKTDNLPSDPADASDIAASFVKIRKYLQLLARSDSAIATDNATELGELNANGGSGAGDFDNATDAVEALRDAVLTAGAIADAVHDEAVEGVYTHRQLMRLVASSIIAKLSGADTTTITFRDLSDTKDRIVATVDSYGNRSALTLDVT